MRTKYIRYSRIAKHVLFWTLCFGVAHLYEVQHYYYMKKFNDINN